MLWHASAVKAYGIPRLLAHRSTAAHKSRSREREERPGTQSSGSVVFDFFFFFLINSTGAV